MMVSFFYIQVFGDVHLVRANQACGHQCIAQCEEVVVIPLRKFLLDEVVDAHIISDEKDGRLTRVRF